jgi:hypothetical protein
LGESAPGTAPQLKIHHGFIAVLYAGMYGAPEIERSGNGLNDGALQRGLHHSYYRRMVQWLQAASGIAKRPSVLKKGQMNDEKAL